MGFCERGPAGCDVIWCGLSFPTISQERLHLQDRSISQARACLLGLLFYLKMEAARSFEKSV
jgi:hypothetical protein